MASSLEFHHVADPMWKLYSRAARKKRSTPKPVNPSAIPALEARLYGASSDPARVKEYAELCGFEKPLAYPLTWPHILAFPLHMRLLTDPAFPLPLLGLVHLRNSITQHRQVHHGENLDVHCQLADPVLTSRGLEFDIRTEVFSSGRLVWSEISTNLFRQKSTTVHSDRKQTGATKELPTYSMSSSLSAPESIGRRYGRVSGDINPIHMHALTARAFGFPRAIAHGMWTKARSVALLQHQQDWQQGPVEIETAFKKPLFLPGRATLNWESTKSRTNFQLLNAKGDAPHIVGSIRWL
ncbi:MAG: hypothetical protein CL583_00925 [Alteromonadaceae bacterium]|nr:hypothetical protein [Alteromonadaceae bacterium]|tara:strand:- start:4119 stop:5006 length:888 start_codon:yes stop_codon:yes gene_type:complete